MKQKRQNTTHKTNSKNWRRGRINWRRGRMGETLALLWLQLRGYKLLARNVRLLHTEMDLVMQHKGTLVLIEVKTGRRAQTALAHWQQQKLLHALPALLSRFPKAGNNVRLDALLLRPWRWPQHIIGIGV